MPQRKPGGRRSASGARFCVLFLAMLCAWEAQAQTPTNYISPSLNTRLTYSDNIDTASDGKRDEWVLEVAPSISLVRQSGRFNGRLAASWRNLVYANDSDRNTSFLALDGRGAFEAVENLLFVDVLGSISRDVGSGLTGRAAGDPLSADKDNETRVFAVGPRLQFRLGSETEASVRYTKRWLQTGSSTLASDRTVDDWAAQLSAPTAFGRFGWALGYTRSDTEYGGALATEYSQETTRATVFATVTPQFRLRGIVGHESYDYEVREGESGSIVGGGFDWSPTPRTTVSATTEERLFGQSYKLDFAHRTARTAWRLDYAKDIQSSLDTRIESAMDVYYDQLFEALKDSFPDPAERDAYIRRRLAGGFVGFVSNNYFLSRRLTASASLIGKRNLLTLTLHRADRTRLGDPVGNSVLDDFATFDRVRDTVATLSLRRDLTPRNALTAGLTRSRAQGEDEDGSSADTRRTSLSLGMSRKLAPDATGAIVYRHTKASGTSDYTENSLAATLTMRF